MGQNIGLPDITVEFKERASTAKTRSNTGIVLLILKDTTELGLHEVTGSYDIPSGLSEKNKKYIEITLLGNVTAPNKVLVYVLGGEDTLDKAFEKLETVEFNYLAMPVIEEAEKTKVKTFIEKMRKDIKFRVKAVLALAADSEGIVDADQDSVEMKEGTFNKDEYCCAFAGLITGTPSSQSITYAVPKNVLNIPSQTKAEVTAKINAGKLVLIKEAGKIRVARGVNSLVTTTDAIGNSFKKIKLVDTMDLIHNDIRRTCIDSYIGKVPNSYDNKCVLISAISEYLGVLAKDELIEKKFSVEINMDKQIEYLRNNGANIAEMTEDEIRQANTKDNVFLKINITLIDTMENIDVSINI